MLSQRDNTTGQEVFLAATNRADPTQTICLPINSYFNSGILLINVSEWRKQHISEKCLQLGTQWNWSFHDQDILNYLCSNQVEYLDWSWNFMAPLFYLAYNPETGLYDRFSTICQDKFLNVNAPTAAEFYKIKQNIKIVHFVGTKPWQSSSYGVRLHNHTVNICKELSNYIDIWLQTAGRLDFLSLNEKMQNLDSIAFNSAFLNTELRKRIDKLFRRYRLYRKIMGGALLFLFILNIITLSLILFD